MTLTQLKQIIRRYLDGRANSKEQLLLDEWSRQAEKDSRPVDAVESEVRQYVVLDNLRRHIGAGPVIDLQPPSLLKRYRMAAAASVILLSGVGASWVYRYRILDKIDPVPVQRIAAGPFRVREILLPDSSVVVLNAGGEIDFPQYFRGPERMVVLNGEGFFKVIRNLSQPFIVRSSNLQVRVLGTSFLVSNTSASPTARVGVKTGKVGVTYEGVILPVATLTAEQDLVYDKASNTINLTKNAGDKIDIDWTTKKLIFKSETLSHVFEAIERTFNINIRVEPSLQNLRFTGSFGTNDSLPEVMKIISMSYGLKIQKGKNGDLLVR